MSTSVSVTAADATFQGENNDDYVGGSVAGAADGHADGRADLVIGAHRDDTTGSDAGAAYLLLGPATGTIDLATVGSKALGVAGDDWAGQAVSTAGDIDNDGFDDVLIGVPSRTIGTRTRARSGSSAAAAGSARGRSTAVRPRAWAGGRALDPPVPHADLIEQQLDDPLLHPDPVGLVEAHPGLDAGAQAAMRSTITSVLDVETGK